MIVVKKQDNSHSEYKDWQNKEALKAFEIARDPFRHLNSLIAEEVLAEHYEGPVAVEVGAGCGELQNLTPNFEFISSERILHNARNIPFERNPVVSDAYTLPFADSSINTIVGYSVYDIFENLDEAMSEVERVLKSGGRFIHFLDLRPSAVAIIRSNLKKGILTVADESPCIFVQYPIDFVLEKLKGADNVETDLKNCIMDYIQSPAEIFSYCEATNPRVLSTIRETINALCGKNFRAFNIKDSFRASLNQSSVNSGLTTIEDNVRTKSKSEEVINHNGQIFNVLINDVGDLSAGFDSSNGRELLVSSSIQVFASQKIKPAAKVQSY